MRVNADAAAQLNMMIAQDNFNTLPCAITPGVEDPALRAQLNQTFRLSLEEFASALGRNATRTQFLDILKKGISRFDRTDLENREAERVAQNFERVLDCIGLDNSHGILNNWIYSTRT